MAKKPKYFLQYKLDADFTVQVDPERRDNIADEIMQNKVCLSLTFVTDDGDSSVGVYPDQIEDGELRFSMQSSELLHVSIKGSYFSYLDPKWEQGSIDKWKTLGELKVHSNHVYDSEPTLHYINGSEDDYKIGTVSLVQR